MKNIFITFLILISFTRIFAQANYDRFDHFYGAQIDVGMTIFDLEPLKNNFTEYINEFKRQYSIPLQVQRLYPANISWSAYFFWYFSQEVSFIIGPEYTSTRAFSRYEDYSGTLDIKSEVKQIYLSIGLQLHLQKIKYIQPLFGFNLGVTRFNYEDNSELNLNGGLMHSENQSAFSDAGYLIEVYTGFTYNLNFVVAEFTASYRYVSLYTLLVEPNTFNIKLGIKKGFFK